MSNKKLNLSLKFETLLRDYQIDAINKVLDWLKDNPGKNPCINLPTGSGKSWIIAALGEYAMKCFPKGRILVVTHTEELVMQDYDKMLKVWPDASIGVYCAGLKRKDTDCRITFASVASAYRHPELFEGTGLLIVDEAHRIDMSGGAVMYHTLINSLRTYVPNMIVIGLTATPYRTGQGYLTDGKEALFHAILKGADILELVKRGYLAPLRSKATEMALDLSKVHTVKGDYKEDELAEIMDTDERNAYIADLSLTVMDKAADKDKKVCNHGVFFCCSVNHAKNLAKYLREYGISAEAVYGDMAKEDRKQVLDDFKSGKLRAVTCVNILTTGFDYPDIDFIALCRPTKSPNLYVQMAGRGMRPKSPDVNPYCIVMDFGKCVERFGPITALDDEVIRKAKEKNGLPPTKKCPKCFEIVSAGTRKCPHCGLVFQGGGSVAKPTDWDANADIMGMKQYKSGRERIQLRKWRWSAALSTHQHPQLLLRLYPDDNKKLLSKPIKKYFLLCHSSKAARKIAWENLLEILHDLKSPFLHVVAQYTKEDLPLDVLENIAEYIQDKVEMPKEIELEYNGRGPWPNRIHIVRKQLA